MSERFEVFDSSKIMILLMIKKTTYASGYKKKKK